MERALLLVLGCGNLPLQFARFHARALSTERSEPVLHALHQVLLHVDVTLALLIDEQQSYAVQRQSLFAWMCRESLPQVTLAMERLLAAATAEDGKIKAKLLRFLANEHPGSGGKVGKPAFSKRAGLELLPLIARAFLAGDELQSPTRITLLARDFICYLVWRYSAKTSDEEEDEQEISILGDVFSIALKREMAWSNNSATMLLHDALHDVLIAMNTEQDKLPSRRIISLIGMRRLNAEETNEEEEHWKSILAALSDSHSPQKVVHANLLEACLLLGRRSKSQTLARLQAVLPFAIKALSSPALPKQTHALAGTLIRSVSVSNQNAAGIQAALFPLLDDAAAGAADGISSAAIELLVESSQKDVASMHHELQTRLKPGGTVRDLSMQVLTKVLEFRTGRGVVHHTSDGWDEKLADLLLQQLADAQVGHRQIAAKSVASLLVTAHQDASQSWGASVLLPKLCKLLVVEQSKSAAAEAFVSAFSQAGDLTSLPALLRAIMLEIQAPYQEAAFALTPRWLAMRGPTQHFPVHMVLDACCEQAQTMPQLFSFARRLGTFLHQSKSGAAQTLRAEWIQHLIPKLNSRAENVVDRLAPFLLLRVFPRISLEDVLAGECAKRELLQALCLAFSQQGEFPAVKRTAVELLAHIHASSLPWQIFLTILDGRGTWENLNAIVPGGFSALTAQDEEEEVAHSLLKSALFGLCQALVCNIIQGEFGPETFPDEICGGIVMRAWARHIALAPGDDLVEGFAEYFTLALVCEAFAQWEQIGLESQATAAATTTRSQTSAVVVEELDETAVRAVDSSLNQLEPSMEIIFQSLLAEGGASSPAVQDARAFASNVLCQVLRCFLSEKSSLAAACLHQAVSPPRIKLAGFGLCKSLFAKLLGQGSQIPNEAREAFYLVAFTCSFTNMKLSPESSALSAYELTLLVHACLKDLSAEANGVVDKTVVLRLVGVVLTFPSELLLQLPDGTLGRIQHALAGIANLDALQEARLLSREILKSFERST